jgi:membrane protease YdiL (CAAX protease family)
LAKIKTALQKFLHFFLVKIIVGILAVGGVVALTQWLGQSLLDKTSLSGNFKNITIAILNSVFALVVYIFLFKNYEKRKISELSVSTFSKNAAFGFITGFVLQLLFILCIYFFADYKISHVNTFASIIPAFTSAFTAGFVAELLIVGVFFRLTEEQLGTSFTLIILTIIFAIIHANAKNATWLSVLATATQAGILLPAAFIVSRSLWVPIFLHFAWDFAEPGIFGGFNPGNSVNESLFVSKIDGAASFTGGLNGPQNSIQSFLLCLIVSAIFLWIAKKDNCFLKPAWRT